METIMTDLFTPMKLGGLALPNRIWMSAMTRAPATPDSIPTPLMAEYYAQRASAGLIVTKCTAVSARQGRHQRSGPLEGRADQGLARGDRRGP
jgi:N-ethylmaleimide reductase